MTDSLVFILLLLPLKAECSAGPQRPYLMPYLLLTLLIGGDDGVRSLCDLACRQLGSALRLGHDKELLRGVAHLSIAALNSCLQEALS